MEYIKPFILKWLESSDFLIYEEWILCPSCMSKTRIRVREDTTLENFPLFCPKCKHETLINVKKLNITLITEPVAKTQE